MVANHNLRPFLIRDVLNTNAAGVSILTYRWCDLESRRPDEFLNSTSNVTNRLDPGSMSQVIIENLLAELDAPEEWFYDDVTRTLYFVRPLFTHGY